MNETAVLNGVPETLLVPLFYRAQETQADAPLIHDEKAVEIVNAIEYDFSHCDKWLTQACVVVRTEIFQDVIRGFLDAHPDSIVINLAAGLDNRFSELDNGQVIWFDLDFPDVISIRRNYIEETDRRRFISSDALDFGWIDEIDAALREKPTLIIAEGLLPYLKETDARRLLSTMADRFTDSRIILEIFGSIVVGREWMVSEFKHIKPTPTFHWSPRDPYELENWDSRFRTLAVENLFDRHPHRWRGMRFLFKSRTIKNLMGSRCITLQLNQNR